MIASTAIISYLLSYKQLFREPSQTNNFRYSKKMLNNQLKSKFGQIFIRDILNPSLTPQKINVLPFYLIFVPAPLNENHKVTFFFSQIHPDYKNTVSFQRLCTTLKSLPVKMLVKLDPINNKTCVQTIYTRRTTLTFPKRLLSKKAARRFS